MSWESRKRGGRYYTRSRREGGRIVREYVGGGILGSLTAQVDAIDRVARQDERVAAAAERSRADVVRNAGAELHAAVAALIAAEYDAAGFHRHDRGPWRRRRASSNREP